ncbi:hypothetical protein V6N13_062038 [Hibiscus sabdariffa]
MVNDGVIMAKVDELEDLVEDIEVKLVRQLVSKTIDLFGDGTATLVVLVQALARENKSGCSRSLPDQTTSLSPPTEMKLLSAASPSIPPQLSAPYPPEA